MPLNELTDRNAVLKAIDEYDRLGQDAFLDRYGFGRSRGYILRFDGKEYDSKAITGAAFGYQFPDRGPLPASDFVGGGKTVQRKLEELRFEILRASDPWTREEVERIVRDYFDMLTREAREEAYSKTDHRERLRELLRGRSYGSVEFKHQNISAVLNELGLPYIRGYKPRSNVQDLLRDVVGEFIERETRTLSDVIDGFEAVRPPVELNFDAALVDPPSPEDSIGTLRRRLRVPRKYNYAERDERNRKLGRAGEEWALGYERYRLTELGRADLAQQVDWLANRLGDGTGYDIVSYDEDGAARYVEVKTTNGGGLTPFVLSENELATSRENGNAYCLYRIFEFNTAPRLFVLRGDLSVYVDLVPDNYRAHLKTRF